MVGLDFRIPGADVFKNPLPQISAESLYVRLVGHRDAFAALVSRILKCGYNYPFHSLTSVQLFLSSDLIVSSFFEETSGPAVGAFCVLTKNYKVNIFVFRIFER